MKSKALQDTTNEIALVGLIEKVFNVFLGLCQFCLERESFGG